MKSGTSYLQRLVMENRDAAGRARGAAARRRPGATRSAGVAEVLDRKRVVARPGEGAWQLLVDEMAAWDGTGLISMEFLGPGRRRQDRAGRVVVPRAGSVEVVLTARDLGRNVPAMWQEALKNGRTWTFAEYVAGVADGAATVPGPARCSGASRASPRMCRRWGEAVGADRVTVVTVPPPGADRGRCCGSASPRCWASTAAGVRQPGPGNESLGAASAEVLRQLNGVLDDLDFGDYAPVV